jgi:dihydropteroate synthase
MQRQQIPTKIMGILNATPDSFSDGGRYQTCEVALNHALQMLREGADVIDVGGESTRPGSSFVSIEEEIARVVPIIRAIRSRSDCDISIDTYKSEVAIEAIKAGANIINDVWGFQWDTNLAKIAANNQCYSILMHNQENTQYEGDILKCMRRYFDKSIELALQAGLDASKIILDPGIGFGKTADQNIEVLARLNEIVSWGYPVLLGTSRKSTIGKILDLPPLERLEGTLATTALGIQAGVAYVRVHDVKENLRVIKVCDAIIKGIKPWIESV